MVYPIVQKFIDNCESYNKDITTVKYQIVQDFDADDYMYILARLGFGTDRSMPNYKWGKRIFLKDSAKLSWISTNSNGYITISTWDKIDKCNTYKDIKPFFSKYNALDHVCNCLSKRSYVQLYKRTDLPRYIEDIKEETLPYKKALNSIQKINNKTFGLSQGCFDTLFFDLDNRNGQCATHNLQKLLNLLKIKISDLYYLEQNFFSGGLHCAVKLDKSLKQNDFAELEHNLNELDIHVECNFVNKLLRLPFSYEYIPMKLSNDINLNKEYIDSKYYVSTFKEFIDQINQQKFALQTSTLLISEKQVQKYKKYNNYWSKKPQMFKRIKEKYIPKFYEIKPGERWATLSKIVPFGKALGYSLEDLIHEIREVDAGSHDLKLWDDGRLYSELAKFYEGCPDGITISSNFKGYISNAKLLDNYTSSVIHNDMVVDKLVNKFNQFYCQKRHLKSLSKDKLDVIRLMLPHYIEEIVGKMIYDINTKKSHIDPNLLYLNGFQLSDTHISRMQDYLIKKLDLTNNPYAKTSIQYLKESIIEIFKYLGMEEINIINKARNWMNGCCKSFRVNNICRVYDLMQSLINKVINNNIFLNKLNSYQYGQYILYISLQGKTIVTEDDNEKWIKDDIPIPILE